MQEVGHNAIVVPSPQIRQKLKFPNNIIINRPPCWVLQPSYRRRTLLKPVRDCAGIWFRRILSRSCERREYSGALHVPGKDGVIAFISLIAPQGTGRNFSADGECNSELRVGLC